MDASEVQLRNGLYGFEFLQEDLRRVPSEERKTYDIKQMWQRTHEICNLIAKGYKYVEVAEILNITPQTVSNTANSELGKLKISELRQERDEEAKKTVEKVRVLRDKALAIYNEICDNENGQATLGQRKDVADTILLELSGLRVPTKIQSASVSTILTAEELASFRERGMKAAKEVGKLIDV